MNGADVVAGVGNRSITVVLFVMCSDATHLFGERGETKLIVYTNICQICQTGTDLFGEAQQQQVQRMCTHLIYSLLFSFVL